jgi:methionyl-tRNA formyltransferase
MGKEPIIITTIKSWNIQNAKDFKSKLADKYKIIIFTDKKELNSKKIRKINPKYIFFPHWSWKIPINIWKNYECIIFHMTDLPFGRGGSPLQNLIVNGFDKTKISAIRAVKELDVGPIYLKRSLSLQGSAEEIYQRASKMIFEKMIPHIIENNPKVKKQKGKIVKFKRRKPQDSNIKRLKDIKQIYDYIRMLDAEGYPKAFIETKNYRVRFKNARFENNKLTAETEFEVKNEK